MCESPTVRFAERWSWSVWCVVACVVHVVMPLEGQVVRYRLEVDNTWSHKTHPGAFPAQAHFSWFGGATHNAEATFWQEGELASPGITQMAEDGSTFILMTEVERKRREGSARGPLSWMWWFCPSATRVGSCGATTVEFEMEEEWPLVTLVSMLGPSPDWFIGVSGLPLRESGRWLEQVVVDLRPYDNGTRSANRWALFGPRNIPPDPITLITEESGQLVGPGSLGTFTFTLLSRERFVRGDTNRNGEIEITDAIQVLQFLFLGSAAIHCEDAADADDDGEIGLTDAVYSLNFQFLGGPPPPPPFPEMGTDPSRDGLSCP